MGKVFLLPFVFLVQEMTAINMGQRKKLPKKLKRKVYQVDNIYTKFFSLSRKQSSHFVYPNSSTCKEVKAPFGVNILLYPYSPLWRN